MVPYLCNMLNFKYRLYFAILFSLYYAPTITNDFYAKFHQADYKIDFQRIELIDYNKSFLNFMEIKTFKYNRTLAAVNITVNSKITMSNEVEVVVKFYKFLSNEYRILRGSSFQVNFCKSLAANLVGLQIYFKCGNLTSCQLLQETTYRMCNIYPDESQFPSFMPHGEYKFEMNFIFKDDIIVTTAMYLKIYRPIPIPVKHKRV